MFQPQVVLPFDPLERLWNPKNSDKREKTSLQWPTMLNQPETGFSSSIISLEQGGYVPSQPLLSCSAPPLRCVLPLPFHLFHFPLHQHSLTLCCLPGRQRSPQGQIRLPSKLSPVPAD